MIRPTLRTSRIHGLLTLRRGRWARGPSARDVLRPLLSDKAVLFVCKPPNCRRANAADFFSKFELRQPMAPQGRRELPPSDPRAPPATPFPRFAAHREQMRGSVRR